MLSGFDIRDFMNDANSNDDIGELLGIDLFGLLPSSDDPDPPEEEEEEKEHVVKFRYSESRKRKLLDAFKVTYVNDYGRSDPYHRDDDDSFVEQVKNEIHAIYGNRSIVQYIIAMRKVLQIYRDMYDKSIHRMFTSFPAFVEMVVSGEIPGPVNHPLIRTNIPSEILLRYILNDKLDPNDIRQFIANQSNTGSNRNIMVDLSTLDEDWEADVEYEVMDPLIQKRVLQSWLSGKLKDRGLDKNEATMVYGLTSHYDHVEIGDIYTLHQLDGSLSNHPDIISWRNTYRNMPKIHSMKHNTEDELLKKRRAMFIEAVMSNRENRPEITIPDLIGRMERIASDEGRPVVATSWLNRYKLYLQGIIRVKKDKYGRDVYVYRDKSRMKRNSINSAIRDIEKKAEAFRTLTDTIEERFRSVAYSDLISEIREEQDKIRRYGIAYYTDGE